MATNVDLGVNDFEGIAAFVKEQSIDLVVVGPEDPLVKGISDFFSKDVELQNVGLVGPTAAGAIAGAVKDFSKEFAFTKHVVTTTAMYKTFYQDSLEEGLNYVSSHPLPVVLNRPV